MEQVEAHDCPDCYCEPPPGWFCVTCHCFNYSEEVED